MKIKIGSLIHNSRDEPIMLILTQKEKLRIANMSAEENKFLVDLRGHFKSEEEGQAWMKDIW